jgi:hypothetical protein
MQPGCGARSGELTAAKSMHNHPSVSKIFMTSACMLRLKQDSQETTFTGVHRLRSASNQMTLVCEKVQYFKAAFSTRMGRKIGMTSEVCSYQNKISQF